MIAHRDTILSTIPQLLAERDQIFSTLSNHPHLQVWSSTANFVFLRLTFGDISAEQADSILDGVFQQLRSQGTLIRKISGGLRITVGTPAENQRTIERLQQAIVTIPL